MPTVTRFGIVWYNFSVFRGEPSLGHIPDPPRTKKFLDIIDSSHRVRVLIEAQALLQQPTESKYSFSWQVCRFSRRQCQNSMPTDGTLPYILVYGIRFRTMCRAPAHIPNPNNPDSLGNRWAYGADKVFAYDKARRLKQLEHESDDKYAIQRFINKQPDMARSFY